MGAALDRVVFKLWREAIIKLGVIDHHCHSGLLCVVYRAVLIQCTAGLLTGHWLRAGGFGLNNGLFSSGHNAGQPNTGLLD